MAIRDLLTPIQLKTLLQTQNLITVAKKYNVSKQYISQLYAEYKAQYPDLFAEPVITPAWLKEQLATRTILEICNETGKSYHQIRKLMEEYGLAKNTATASFDEDYIREQYVTFSKSDRSLADHYGCSVSLIRKFRYEHAIFKSDRKPLCERLSKADAVLLISKEKLSIQELCQRYDATLREVEKLLDAYGIVHPQS